MGMRQVVPGQGLITRKSTHWRVGILSSPTSGEKGEIGD